MKRPDWLNQNVTAMTVTSFFSDACYEMVLAVLPGFLPLVSINAAALGWIEGASDAFSSFLKLFAGWYSDRVGHRKWMVVAGYFFTGTGLSLFALAHSWPVILAGRLVSWFGKGMRGSLRDAMMADSVDAAVRGKAFGFHRAGDTLGAVAGPLAGALLIRYLPGILTLKTPDQVFRVVFVLSLIPGLAAPLTFALFVREARRKSSERRGLLSLAGSLPSGYRRFLGAVGVFGTGDFSPTLLVLAAATLLGPRFGAIKAAEFAALLYLLRNLIYAGSSYPIGALSDLRSKTPLLAGGFLLAAASSALAAWLFASSNGSLTWLAIVFAMSGIFAAAQDTLEGVIPAGFATPDTRGTVFGLLGAVNGVGDLAASALVGTLWTAVSPAAAFAVASGLMLLGAGGMALVKDA